MCSDTILLFCYDPLLIARDSYKTATSAKENVIPQPYLNTESRIFQVCAGASSSGADNPTSPTWRRHWCTREMLISILSLNICVYMGAIGAGASRWCHWCTSSARCRCYSCNEDTLIFYFTARYTTGDLLRCYCDYCQLDALHMLLLASLDDTPGLPVF